MRFHEASLPDGSSILSILDVSLTDPLPLTSFYELSSFAVTSFVRLGELFSKVIPLILPCRCFAAGNVCVGLFR